MVNEPMKERASYKDLEKKLAEAENFINALGKGEAETLLGDQVFLLRPKKYVRELETDNKQLEELVSKQRTELRKMEAALARKSKEQEQVKKGLEESERKLDRIQRLGKMGDWEFDTRTQSIVWSQQVYRLFERDPKAGPPGFEENMAYYYPEDSLRLQEQVRAAVERGTSIEDDYRLKMPSGKSVWHHGTIHSLMDNSGSVVKLYGTVQDITQRKDAEEALKQSRERLKEAQAIAHMGSWEWDIQRDKLTWSDEMFHIFGFEVQDRVLPFSFFQDAVHPQDRHKVQATIASSLADGTMCSAEYRIIRPNGEERTILAQGIIYRDTDNNPLKMTGISLDISRRKQAELQIQKDLQEKKVLLKEIHHRVKNNLQVISSMLGLQIIRAKDTVLSSVLQESINRVNTLALVHEDLYKSKSFSQIDFIPYVKKLVKNLINSYSHRKKIGLKLHIGVTHLTIKLAIPCGLILNELITNSLKYAFPNKQQGLITISLNQLPDNGIYRLIVQDNGIGLPRQVRPGEVKTLGMHIIHILAEQLEGTVSIEQENGTKFIFSFKG